MMLPGLGEWTAYCCDCGQHFRPADVVTVQNEWDRDGVTMCRRCAERFGDRIP